MSGAAAAQGPHPDDLLPAYALGSLEADEIQAVERHLATCPQCAAEVDRLRRTVDLLPLAARPVPPPQGSREALFSRIRRDRLRHHRLRHDRLRREAAESVAVAPPASLAIPPGLGPATPARPPASWGARLPWTATAAALLLAGVIAWQAALSQREASTLRTENARLVATADELAQALAGLDPGSSRLVSLRGADAAPQAEGVVVYDPRGRTAVVVLDNLPPLALGQVYQLWLLRPDAPPTSAGTLAPDAVGTSGAVVRAGNELGLYNGAAVTLEPAPGQAAPSGPFVVRTSL
ncbi:MAG TPA: anti-sigma factor [Chloroflexota bacterium]|nr:anti-sigma factor [Chloroflexota bacterium]